MPVKRCASNSLSVEGRRRELPKESETAIVIHHPLISRLRVQRVKSSFFPPFSVIYYSFNRHNETCKSQYCKYCNRKKNSFCYRLTVNEANRKVLTDCHYKPGAMPPSSSRAPAHSKGAHRTVTSPPPSHRFQLSYCLELSKAACHHVL